MIKMARNSSSLTQKECKNVAYLIMNNEPGPNLDKVGPPSYKLVPHPPAAE
jgi:hypothetical protein